MKIQAVILLTVVCLASALPAFEVAEDDDVQEYYSVPRQRQRRQVDITKSGQGARVSIGHGGTILDNDRHRLDGSGFASKNFRPSGPLTVGGQLDYNHKPTGSGGSLGVQNTHRFGTDVSAQGNYNLYRGNQGRTTLDANAGYSRHFGGPGGTGRPNYGGGLEFKHRF